MTPSSQRAPGAVPAQLPGPPLELGALASLRVGESRRVDPAGLQHVLVEDHHAVLADRAHRQLRALWQAELAHQDDVEGGAQRAGHPGGHRHPAARQPEHDDVPTGERRHPAPQLLTRVPAVLERHPSLLASDPCSPWSRPIAIRNPALRV